MSETAESRSERVDHWDAFMKALSAPPKANPRLRKLLARKPA